MYNKIKKIFEDDRKQKERQRWEARRYIDFRDISDPYVLNQAKRGDVAKQVEIKLMLEDIFIQVRKCNNLQQDSFIKYYVYGYTLKEISVMHEKSVVTIHKNIKLVLEVINKNCKQ